MSKYVDRADEMLAIRRLEDGIRHNPKFEVHPNRTLLINVSPDYSSIVSQNLIHALSIDGDKLEMFPLEVPYPGENYRGYELNFIINFKEHAEHFQNFILTEAAVITGNNYSWITDCMFRDFGIGPERILTTALYEHEDSIYKCDVVGEKYDGEVEFYWERYNKHFES